MSLLELLPRENIDLFDTGLRNMLIAHFPWMKQNDYYEVTPVSGVAAEIYRGDFHGLLTSIGVPVEYHQLYTLFNGYKSSTDFRGDKEDMILLPQRQQINQLVDIYQTRM